MPKIKSTPVGECIFACTKCSDRFSTSANLRTHERNHAANGTLTNATDNLELLNTCKFCNKRFVRMNELNKHILIHTGDKSLVCLKCEKIFADHANLRKHQANNMCDLNFKCTECNKRYPTESGLAKHKRVHFFERPYVCMGCPQRFKHSTDLDEHICNQLTDDCSVLKSGQSFADDANLLKHQANNTCYLKFKCPECNKQYPTESGLAVHRDVHFFERPYVCEKCPQRFKHSTDLHEHICSQLSDDGSVLNSIKPVLANVSPASSVSAIIPNVKVEKKEGKHNSAEFSEHPFVCTQCNYQFSTQSGLQRHERTHTHKRQTTPGDFNQSSHNPSPHRHDDLVKQEPLDTEDCHNSSSTFGKTLLNETTSSVQLTNGAGLLVTFKCTECDKEFPNEFNYSKHKRVHYFERPYVCRNCPQRFKSSSDLNQHVCTVPLDDCSFLSSPKAQDGIAPTTMDVVEDNFRSTISDTTASNDDKLYPCMQCPKRFSKSLSLRLHERVHTGERQYSCMKCDKHYTLRSTLQNHQRIHTDDYPYVCGRCSRRFKTDVEMRKHEHVHSEQRKYPCTRCTATFEDSSKLHRHVQSHSYKLPCVCSECGKRFAKDAALKKHVSMHYFDRPYTCSQCPERFKLSGELKEHERVHSGQSKYPCDQCTEIFEDLSKLHEHMHSHRHKRSCVCSECEKRFAHEQTLKKHVETHYFDRPYACSQCEKRFKLSSELQEHVLVHVKCELDAPAVIERDFHFSQFSDVVPFPVSIVKTEMPDSEESENQNHSMSFVDSSFKTKSLILRDVKPHTSVQCEEKRELSDELNESNESDRDVLLPQFSDEASSVFIKKEISCNEDETEAMILTVDDIDLSFRSDALLLPDTQSCVSFDWNRIKIEPNEGNAPAVN